MKTLGEYVTRVPWARSRTAAAAASNSSSGAARSSSTMGDNLGRVRGLLPANGPGGPLRHLLAHLPGPVEGAGGGPGDDVAGRGVGRARVGPRRCGRLRLLDRSTELVERLLVHRLLQLGEELTLFLLDVMAHAL